MKHETRRRQTRTGRRLAQRRGSTLLIVMVLMGMLSLLGVIFYIFAAQERSNSEYYSEASKELNDPGLDADVLFDWALEQIIVGTDPRLKNSMLWGSRHSLLSNAIGFSNHRPSTDMQPFNGEGVNVIYDMNTGLLGVDQNRNGLIDDPTVNAGEADYRYLLDYVDSPAVRGLTERQLYGNPAQYYPQSDVGYTYPDINNVFLSYVGKVRDASGTEHRVVKPSYMVPGVLRPGMNSPSNPNWYNAANTAGRVMRGHPSHLYVPPTSSPATPAPRYLTNAEASSLIGPGATGFPVIPMNGAFPVAATSQGRMGAYSSGGIVANEMIEFDYDNDGDGVCESILMDLDFPPQQDPSGKLFVPLFLVTIHDLDSLVNLNAHGNLARVLSGPNDVGTATQTSITSSAGQPFGWDTLDSQFHFISASNYGLGPAEINPLWALNRRMNVDDNTFNFTQFSSFFGGTPNYPASAALPWGETANMEFLWSKVGRYQVAPTKDLFVGVYGDAATIYNATNAGTGRINSSYGGLALPRPGLALADDNNDVTTGQGYAPYFQHPMDYTGLGSYWTTGVPPAIKFFAGAGTTPASMWITYSKYGNDSGNTIKWGTSPSATLMNTSVSQALGDDPYEVAFYTPNGSSVDSLLTPDEMLYLQLNNSEINRLNVTSRLANLIPFNFDKTPGITSRAEFIRRRFTVLSNDRKSYSLPISARSGLEYSVDPNTGTNKFPPQFGTIPRYQTTSLAEDPLRPALRTILEMEVNGQQGITRLQRKMSLNSLLTGNTLASVSTRPLTMHPDDPGTTPITTTYPAPNPSVPYPPTTAAAQEYWARRDRQQLARDIYVLLYLLGNGDDTINTATQSNAGNAVYSNVQLAEMAQFAVNLVDAMDRDSVISRFEYDTDLSDGWNLDDDPYSTTEGSRAEVFGVERQDLSISEAMAIQCQQTPLASDHTATPWDDSKSHAFAYVELYNHSPFDITFGNNEVWQVTVSMQGGNERRLTFKSGAGTISSQKMYSIGCADMDFGATSGKSVFKVDTSGGGNADAGPGHPYWLAPYQDFLDLDLLDVTVPTTSFRVEDNAATPNDLTATPSDWVKQLVNGAPGTAPVTFKLRRRAHPTRSYMPSSQTNDNDNPWVTIDESILPNFSKFDLLTPTDTAAVVKSQLDKVIGSTERKQPLDSTDTALHAPTSGGAGQNNSLKGKSNTPPGTNLNITNFTVWQPHFDRDFASIIDTFFLPVVGPAKLTANLKSGMSTEILSQTTPAFAEAKFLNPNTTPTNRWHRLLEFVEIPTRTNQNLGIGTDFSIPRLPGRMNPNTMRNPDNYAALLDAGNIVGLDLSSVLPGTDSVASMPDQTGDIDPNTGSVKDWWSMFLLSRDGYDQYALNTNGVKMSLPGLPALPGNVTSYGSRPFRSLADVGYNIAGGTKNPSVEDTILRSLPIDRGLATQRRLMEIGSNTAHANGSVDPLIRNRLLSKIAGNTTTRSNSFAIFISVKYFSAAADPAYGGAIRIGGPYNGKAEPEHRGFFVVDRSKLEQGKYSGAANYDFRAFVEYRKTLATQ